MIHHYWRLLLVISRSSFVTSHYLYEFASVVFASFDIGEVKVLEALHIIDDRGAIGIGKGGFSFGLKEGLHTASAQQVSSSQDA